MKTLLVVIVLSSLALAGACRRSESAAQPAPANAPTYALRGTVIEVRAPTSVLVVKHEAIPGFMGAMTMPFHADAATLQTVTPGQAITATLYQKDGDLWLRDVKTAAR